MSPIVEVITNQTHLILDHDLNYYLHYINSARYISMKTKFSPSRGTHVTLSICFFVISDFLQYTTHIMI